jgi:hypothetical protein
MKGAQIWIHRVFLSRAVQAKHVSFQTLDVHSFWISYASLFLDSFKPNDLLFA